MINIKHFLSLGCIWVKKRLFAAKFNEKTVKFNVKYTLRSPKCGGKLFRSNPKIIEKTIIYCKTSWYGAVYISIIGLDLAGVETRFWN
jgi:hypothetical protein